MSKLLIIAYVIISILIFVTYNHLENYINDPYITVIAECGLCNKLQVLLSYLYKANKEGKKLQIYWNISEECPDKYEKLFKAIDNVDIKYSYLTKTNYANNIKNYIYDFKTYWNHEKSNFIKENYYLLLKPLPEIQNEIDNTKLQLGENYIACHIRRTDALKHRDYKKHIKNDTEYINFINQYPKDLKIYIATDCRNTQKKFINLYNDRIIYKKIENNNNLRQTSMQDAVKDIYICVGATYFMKSVGSFSDTIMILRNKQ